LVEQRGHRVAIIGAGYISSFHLNALRRVPGARVVAVCDHDSTRAAALVSRARGANSYKDLASLLAEARPDTAHVLTPAHTHASVVRQLLAAGVHVLTEKPLAVTAADCRELAAQARKSSCALGVSHNFLFSIPYERLLRDLNAGRLGRLDQIDVIWNKPLPAVRSGPFAGWLFADPRNVLFEVGSHSFAHAVHLVGPVERFEVTGTDSVEIPGGRLFFRLWEARGWAGRRSVRFRFAFGDGYPEHYLHVRGTNGSATVDFELDAYTLRDHRHDLLDLDRFGVATRAAGSALVQATGTLVRFLAAQVGLPGGGPYALSIERAVAAFYRSLGGTTEPRLGPDLAGDAIALAEQMGTVARLEAGPATKPRPALQAIPPAKPTVLVLGGTGFIGRALVRKLREGGRGVRVLTRDPTAHATLFRSLGVEIVRGDLGEPPSLEAALDGIRDVYALARGNGRSWDDYLRTDVEPTMRIADLCLASKARLLYASSIAIYAGRPGETITEETPPNPGTLRVNIYSRAKAEIERRLFELHRARGLDVVVFRPGIVIGPGSSPYHWGVGAWPYPSLCRLWGRGRNPLPLVLVDDCAEAMMRALDVPGISGQSFNLVGDPILDAHEYLDELERTAGVNVRRIETPAWRSFAREVVKYCIKLLARSPERRRPSYADCLGRSAAARFSGEKAKRVLGWRPTEDRALLLRLGVQVPVADFFA
jgi:predicted dehydrogenase/nucleoside-diphosphate-sugar epimerase